MKRVTQILASILFIITVLTVYLAFDFAVNTAVSNNYSTNKHHHHDDITFHKTSDLLSSKLKKSDQILKYDNEHNHIINPERRIRNTKQKQNRVKLGQFHKSKTGVKVDHIKKSVKEQRQRLLTNKNSSRKDIKSKNDKVHANFF